MQLLCPLILSMAIGAAFELQELRTEGVSLFSDRELKEVLNFNTGDTLDEERIAAAFADLLQVYSDHGYLKTSLSWSREDGTLYLKVDEGTRFTIGRVELRGNRFFSRDYLLAELKLDERMVFSKELLEERIDELLIRYEDSGFPFCIVRPLDFALNDSLSQIDFTLEIDEGLLTRVEYFEIEGNQQTRAWAIIRQLRMEGGEVYSKRRIEDALKRLVRLEVLKVQGYDLEVTRDGWVAVVVKVNETRSNSVEGALGWSRSGQLTGLVDVRADNLFGTLRSFHFQWMRKEPLSSRLSLSYREPWLFGRLLAAELSLGATVEDTSYTAHSGSVDFYTDVFSPFILGVGGGIERMTALKAPMPSSDELSFSLHSAIDTRDDRSSPQKGVFYTLSTKYALKFYRSSQAVPDVGRERSYATKVRFRFLNFIPGRWGVVYIAAGGGKLYTEEDFVSPSDEFALGGPGTVRGYREEQFFAPQVIWFNAEYRWMLGSANWISPFLDLGSYKNRTDGWIYGWGLGLGLTSRVGLVTISYGIGREDSIGSGKIHFGLLNSF
ncbi:hypothetical protein AMJ40_00685 [candidate division TA06 bacterium DG_26]|uniref:POTRA domain-containing protein n=1 Tax=candidate division TA06 bacterium DG_26 TaxID=1703771 RepID=A0A0S7WLW9_UNCT6|nr:MAG: hypothetical protein AMJ40_00685 [candidate division TA06 bacterium DG_26]